MLKLVNVMLSVQATLEMYKTVKIERKTTLKVNLNLSRC